MKKLKTIFTSNALSIFFTLATLTGSPSAVLAEFGNPVQIVKAGHPRYYDSYTNLDFSNFNRILFLSDGGKSKSKPPSHTRAHQMFVSTDFQCSSSNDVQLDNNHLPFASNSFDLIIMNRGLCPCEGNVTCGGIDTQPEAMENFLQGVVTVLNKKSPNSLALLTGFYFPGAHQTRVPKMWSVVLSKLQKKYPLLQFGILNANMSFAEPLESFIGVVVSTDPEKPLAESLGQLGEKLVR